MNKKVGIVIPAINLWSKYTRAAIESIKTKHDHIIVLINNASTDETAFEAEKLMANRNDFLAVNNPTRNSCAGSWNQGAAICFAQGCDYVMIINNDVILHPDCIDTLVEKFEKDERQAVLMSAVHVGYGNVTKPEDVLTYDANTKANEAETEHPDFSAFMISRTAWGQVGEFDEGFKPIYFEDNDYHNRINLAGFKAFNIPTAVYYHYLSRTQNEATPGQPICDPPHFTANQQYFIKKWGGNPDTPEANYRTPFNDPTKSITSTEQKP